VLVNTAPHAVRSDAGARPSSPFDVTFHVTLKAPPRSSSPLRCCQNESAHDRAPSHHLRGRARPVALPTRSLSPPAAAAHRVLPPVLGSGPSDANGFGSTPSRRGPPHRRYIVTARRRVGLLARDTCCLRRGPTGFAEQSFSLRAHELLTGVDRGVTALHSDLTMLCASVSLFSPTAARQDSPETTIRRRSRKPTKFG